jgi:hypothetical protein
MNRVSSVRESGVGFNIDTIALFAHLVKDLFGYRL